MTRTVPWSPAREPRKSWSWAAPRCTNCFCPAPGVSTLARVQAEVDGDTWFPPFDESAWNEVERLERPADARNEYPVSFQFLERK